MKQLTHKLACAAWVIAVLASGAAPAATLHVWLDSPNPMPPYDSWGNAATNIQDAVDAANPGDTVLVTNGVYATGGRAVDGTMTNRVVIDKAITVQSLMGPEVTVIEGAPTMGGSFYGIRCAYLGTNATLSGFTLTNGNAEEGGGAWCESSASLTNCVVTSNSASYSGGGVYGGTLNHCTLTNNSAYVGGGASGWASGCTLSNCIVTGNSATFGGGAAGSTLYNSTVTSNTAVSVLFIEAYGSGGGVYESGLYNCTLSGNSTDDSGGGAYGGMLNNCTLTGNSSSWNGGAAFDATLNNCTLSDNSAAYGGGGAFGGTLNNCIVYYNSAPNSPNYNGSVLNYSCTTPLPPDGTNNITADPQLATLTHLSVSSPCIGAGDSAYATGVDIDGEPWANPPCMGADQLTSGQATGALTMFIEPEYTNVAPGFAVRFDAQNQGPILASVWDFDDGSFVTNQAITSHAWSAPGNYTVRLKGYNDSFPDGVTATIQIEVSDTVYYVNQANPTPVFPYTSWATAATNIQDGIVAGTLPGRLVLVTNGVYASGSVEAQGTNRMALTGPMLVRSVNGPEVTVIEGAPGIRCAYVGPEAILSGFTLTKGNEDKGGGAWCESSAMLTNCVLAGNSAGVGGGTYGGILNHCTLSGNSATQGGGASGDGIIVGSSCTLNNCVVSGNSARSGGGASWSTLYNCTLSGNSALGVGGGAYYCTLNNCIVYYNLAVDDSNHFYCVFHYSCTTPLPDGSGNIDSEPLLASSSHLSPQSPCIGQGSSAYASGVDIDGEPWAHPPCMGADQLTPGQAAGPLSMAIRAEYPSIAPGFAVNFTADNQGPILSSVWDFGDGTLLTNQPLTSHSWSLPGSYTVQLTGYNDSFPNGVTATLEVEVTNQVHCVNQANPTPLFPYTSWQTAATSIQDAIEAGRTAGGLVLVADGVYASGSVEMQGSNRIALTYPVQVRSVNGPGMTVIAGAAGIRCAYVGAEAILSGFTLTDGNAGSGGGGAWCEHSAILTNCVVTGNSAHDGGGAYGGTLYNCTLSGNSASYGGGANSSTLNHCTLGGNSAYQGGGAFGWASDCTLYNCTLSGNSAAAGGGVFWGTLYNCALSANSASDGGGGVIHGTLYNCALTGNSSDTEGGGVFDGTLYNCTLTGNSAQDGGGVFWGTLYNCILYFNSAPYGPNYTTNSLNSTIFHYSCTTPLPADGEGNITNAPLFVDQLGGNLRLQFNSPCINAGDSSYVMSATDLDGNPRSVGGTVDMGAYEFQAPGSVISYAWLQQFGLPTDGSVDAMDSDADGHTTFQEWVADTDPTNAHSFFDIEAISKSSPAMISFQSSSNRSYTLWSTPQLAPPDWAPVPGEQAIPGNGGTLTLSDKTNAPQRFYRVLVNLP
jgi:PKD repeat protein